MDSGGTIMLLPPENTKTSLSCEVKPHGLLVLVSLTYHYAYTPNLSTS